MKSLQTLVLSIVLLLAIVGQSFGDARDPRGGLSQYVMYGDLGITQSGKGQTATDGWIGTNSSSTITGGLRYNTSVMTEGSLTLASGSYVNSVSKVEGNFYSSRWNGNRINDTVYYNTKSGAFRPSDLNLLVQNSSDMVVPVSIRPISSTIVTSSNDCEYNGGTGVWVCDDMSNVIGDTLLPGSYGHITITGSSGGIAKFTAGTYEIASFKTFQNFGAGLLKIDKPLVGATRIFSQGNVYLEQRTKVFTNSAADVGRVLFYTNSKFTMNNNTEITATVYAPFGKIDVISSSKVFGQLLAKNIKLGNNFNGAAGVFVPFDPVIVSLVGADTFEMPEDLDGNTNTRNTRKVTIPIALKAPTLEAAKVTYEIRALNNADSWMAPYVSLQKANIGTDSNAASNIDLAYGAAVGASPETGILTFNAGDSLASTVIEFVIVDDDLPELLTGGKEYFALVLKDPIDVVLDTDTNAAFSSGSELIYLIPIVSEDAGNLAPDTITISQDSILERNSTAIVLTSNDVDGSNAAITFTLTGGANAGYFTVSNDSLKIKNPAIFENSNTSLGVNPLVVEITATDADGASYAQTFNIRITNRNDEKPQANIDSLALDEGASSSIDVALNDLDSIDNMSLIGTYSPLGTNGGSQFSSSVSFSGSTLNYTHDDSENFQDTVWYILSDAGIEPGNHLDTSYVLISITSLNENKPVLSADTFTVAEDDINGYLITTLLASDADNNTLNYSILSQEHAGAFELSSTTGDLTILNTILVDYENDSFHSINVRVNDGTNNTDVTIYVKITSVLAPIFNDRALFVSENVINTDTAGILIASGFDTNAVNFTLLSQSIGDAFVVNSDGTIVVNDALDIDYEQDSTHVLQVKVSDLINSDTATITIHIRNENDNTPLLADTVFSISETSSVGTLVGQLNGTDADGDILTYSLDSQEHDFAFSIDPDGTIKVSNRDSIDYEIDISHQLVIRVSDGVFSSTATITIDIRNENDNSPLLADTVFSISETSLVGTLVGQLNGTDAEADILTYSLVSQEHDFAFSIDPDGAINVSNRDSIDYEIDISHQLVVLVSDGINTTTANVKVNITNENDNRPLLADRSFTIAEDEVNNYLLGTLIATDADGDVIEYLIESQEHAGAFSLDANSGELRISDSILIDFEADIRHDLGIVAVANGDTARAYVAITIIDKNDNLPVTSNIDVLLSEDEIVGTMIAIIPGTDADVTDNPTFMILSGNDDNKFSIASTSGRVTLDNSLDYETTSSYLMDVAVFTNTDTVYSILTVGVVNVNVSPFVTVDSLFIDENTLAGTIVEGAISAVDEDLTTVIWSLPDESLSDNDLFTIDSLTGQLTLRQDSTIDFEESPILTIVLAASDDSSSTYEYVDINVRDVNDAPVIHNQVIQIEENQPGGTVIGTITSTDEDAGSVATYSLLDSTKFTVDPASGDLMVREGVVLDFEDQKTYFFDVIVTDGEFADTNKTIVSLINVVEVADIKIVEIFDESGRSVENSDEFFTSDDSVTIVFNKVGVLDTIKYSVEEGLNRLQESNNDVTMDIHEKARAEVTVSKVIPVLVIVVDSTVPLDTADNVYYINDSEDSIIVQITYINEDLEIITFDSLIATNEFAKEGKERTMTIIYEDPYGNIKEIDVNVILDTTPPLLVILTPEHKSKHSVLELDVQWFIDDEGVLDTLNNVQLVSQGLYPITRDYTDFAGNSVSVTHVVTIKAAAAGAQIKIVDQVIEQKSNEEILEYFEKKERDTDPGLKNIKLDKDGDGIPDIELANLNVILPVHNSRSIENLTAVEIGIQTSEGLVKRQNLTEFDYYRNKGLIGPTLELTLNFPINGGYSASDSLRVGSIPDSLRAACGQDSTMFKLKIDGITFFVFDHLGQYVTKVRFTGFDLSDPRYQDDKGKVTLALELPQLESGMKSEYGTNWGAGVYIFNGLINTSATPRACLSHVETIVKRTSKTTLLERVGYQRNDK